MEKIDELKLNKPDTELVDRKKALEATIRQIKRLCDRQINGDRDDV